MCIICTDLIKGKLTVKEAWANLQEMVNDIDPIHYKEVAIDLMYKEAEETELEED